MSSTLLRQIKKAQDASAERWTIDEFPKNYETGSVMYTATFIPDDESIYADGIFFVNITFPKEYPFYPPRLRMTTQIFHPNVANAKGHEGNMYIDILYDEWTPMMTITKLLEYVHGLFYKPDFDSITTCNPKAAYLYQNDREKFNAIAKEWTSKYAF